MVAGDEVVFFLCGHEFLIGFYRHSMYKEGIKDAHIKYVMPAYFPLC